MKIKEFFWESLKLAFYISAVVVAVTLIFYCLPNEWQKTLIGLGIPEKAKSFSAWMNPIMHLAIQFVLYLLIWATFFSLLCCFFSRLGEMFTFKGSKIFTWSLFVVASAISYGITALFVPWVDIVMDLLKQRG